MRCSRAVFARKLRIHVRTLEKWEQGRAKPNPQTAALATPEVLSCKLNLTCGRLEQGPTVQAGKSSHIHYRLSFACSWARHVDARRQIMARKHAGDYLRA